jgi:hypothetical protein
VRLAEVLDHVLAGEGSVPRGAARADDDARRGDDALQVGLQAAEVDVALVVVEAAAHAVLEHL